MSEPGWTLARVLLALVATMVVALGISLATWSMLQGRPGPALLFAMSILSGAGAARLLLFD